MRGTHYLSFPPPNAIRLAIKLLNKRVPMKMHDTEKDIKGGGKVGVGNHKHTFPILMSTYSLSL